MAKKQTDGNLALEQQRVIVIPAHDELVARKLRVAAYARVSSSSEDQLNSYRVQNQYYSELISSNPDWEMVDIYADEGVFPIIPNQSIGKHDFLPCFPML